jgi:hypothetical protein
VDYKDIISAKEDNDLPKRNISSIQDDAWKIKSLTLDQYKISLPDHGLQTTISSGSQDSKPLPPCSSLLNKLGHRLSIHLLSADGTLKRFVNILKLPFKEKSKT